MAHDLAYVLKHLLLPATKATSKCWEFHNTLGMSKYYSWEHPKIQKDFNQKLVNFKSQIADIFMSFSSIMQDSIFIYKDELFFRIHDFNMIGF